MLDHSFVVPRLFLLFGGCLLYTLVLASFALRRLLVFLALGAAARVELNSCEDPLLQVFVHLLSLLGLTNDLRRRVELSVPRLVLIRCGRVPLVIFGATHFCNLLVGRPCSERVAAEGDGLITRLGL